jgi:regulator of protease activity HflC (stomatin/prohibitin superfamily)
LCRDEQGVLFRLGRLRGLREPGFRLIIPFVDVLHQVSLRVVTMPIQSQGIITKDNVSVDVTCRRSPASGWSTR